MQASIGALKTSAIFKSGVCVKSCPKSNDIPLVCKPTSTVAACDAHKDARYRSINVAKFCMPRKVSELSAEMKLAYTAAKD